MGKGARNDGGLEAMKCSHLSWLMVLVALGCATPLPTQPPLAVAPLTLPSSEWRVVDQVIVVTDASGTMYLNRNFPEAKSLTQTFVAAMPAADVRAMRPGDYRAGSIGFGGDDRITAPLAAFDRAALADKAAGLRTLGSIDGMGGRTPLHAVLTEIQGWLVGSSGKAALVLFTDGLPDSEERSMAAAERLVASVPDGVCIHAVQSGGDPRGAEFLGRLTGLSDCGSLREADAVGDPARFQDFARAVFAGAAPLPPVAAAPDPCAGVIRLGGVRFGFDQAEITDESAVVLGPALERLRQCEGLTVRVEGHTDSIGSEAYNRDLSERRAEAVRRYLVGAEIEAGRLSARGVGESTPIAPNETAEGRAQNRRVELQLGR
jgi:OOP family OmpA-OmpF porin